MDRRPEFRLLVVEPKSQFRAALVEGLELCRHEVLFECKIVEDAAAANQVLASFAPSVVLVDLHQLGDGGVSFVKQCSSASVPVVVAAESKSESITSAAQACGAAAVVERSEDPEEIDWVVDTLARVAVPTAGMQ